MRKILSAVLAVLFGNIDRRSDAGSLAQAQDTFPNRTVRIVIPYPAGGGTDTIGRLVADQLSRKWGQPVVVENVGGAAGNTGAAQVFRAAPDGYTHDDRLAGTDRDQQLPLQGHAVRSGALDLDRAAGHRPLRAGDAQEFRRRDGQGPGRARQGRAREDHRSDAGRRLGRTSRDRAARDARRHQDDAGPLSRLEPRGERSHRRSCRPDVRHADDLAAAAP